MKRKISLLLALAIIPTAAHAANWVYVTTSSTNAEYFIDKDSVRTISSGYPKKEIVLAWFKIDYSKDRTVSRRESKILYHFDCANQQMALMNWVDYDAQGRVLDSNNFSYPSFKPAVPDTIGYDMLDRACFSQAAN